MAAPAMDPLMSGPSMSGSNMGGQFMSGSIMRDQSIQGYGSTTGGPSMSGQTQAGSMSGPTMTGSILGPVMFGPTMMGLAGLLFKAMGLSSQMSSRLGILSLLLLFISGAYLLFLVDEEKATSEAQK